MSVVKEMYRIWKKFDTANTGTIMYYEMDDYMIELGDEVKLDKRKEIEKIAREYAADLTFTTTVDIVM